jgi:hypothetical protein
MGMMSVILAEVFARPLSTLYILKTCNFELDVRKIMSSE